METTNDINIGKDKWIEWINFDFTNGDNVFQIDDLLRSTFDFWDKLEIQCVAGCCGIDAYSFWKEDIKLAADQMNQADLIKNLMTAKMNIESRSEVILASEKLNFLMNKSVFIQLLDHIVTTVNPEDRKMK
jgi:hypothetical protein